MLAVSLVVLSLLVANDRAAEPDAAAADLAVYPTVSSRIEEVVVYPAMAIVHRTAEIPADGGRFAVLGIPRGIEESSLRVRLEGGEVVGFEGRDRLEEMRAPIERLRELDVEIEALEREIARADDESRTYLKLESHLESLLALDDEILARNEADPRPPAAIWSENLTFLAEKLAENRRRWRDSQFARGDLQVRKRGLELQKARLQPGDGQRVRELVVDTVPDGTGALTLDIEYVVSTAGWKPDYELRVAEDLRRADLVYRAEVWQISGESWDDARVVLSTSRPLRTGKGPSPTVATMKLLGPGEKAPPVPTANAPALAAAPVDSASGADGPEFATPDLEGLSLRFELPRAESIPSRPRPTDVLVGRSQVQLEAEHYCVPAVDAIAWLRARVRNSSPWTMLPGVCALYFGTEFLGTQPVGFLPQGKAILVHLGPDPGLVVTRQRTDHTVRRAGFIGSRDEASDAWELIVHNRGARSSQADGSVAVLLREALPRASDPRVEIEVSSVVPATDPGALWQKERIERGILTWSLTVPDKQDVALRYRLRTTFPTGHDVALD